VLPSVGADIDFSDIHSIALPPKRLHLDGPIGSTSPHQVICWLMGSPPRHPTLSEALQEIRNSFGLVSPSESLGISQAAILALLTSEDIKYD
jgi:hypothetical protein